MACTLHVIPRLIVATLALGSRPRRGLARLQAKREAREWRKVWREWTLTLPKELPLWKLESRWTPECSKNDCKGQKPMAQGVLYTIEKLLKHRCLKWARMTHLDIWNTSYGQKKGRKSNWQFDFRPLKVRNRPNFIVCRWRATYYWKAIDEGYKFVSNLISIEALNTKLWGPQNRESPNFGNFKTPTWEFRDKKPFGCGPHGEAYSIL